MPKITALLVLAVLAATPGPLMAQIYSENFETGSPGPEWSSQDTTVAPYGERFLGRFGNGTVTLDLANLDPHGGLLLECDLYIIETWDGNIVGKVTVHAGSIGTDRLWAVPELVRRCTSVSLPQHHSLGPPAGNGAFRRSQSGITGGTRLRWGLRRFPKTL